MISAKQLAYNIPHLLEKDRNPAHVADVLVQKAKDDSAFHQILLSSIKYLEKYAREKHYKQEASIELAANVSISAVDSLTKVFEIEKRTRISQNKALIGGFRVRKGDLLVDGSIASRFRQLRTSLKQTV